MSLTQFEKEAVAQETNLAHVEEFEEAARLLSMQEALAEYPAHKRQQEAEECPHDELDHGICLDCGKDCFDDVIAAAEFAADCANDR